VGTIDEFLRGLPDHRRTALEQVRDLAESTAPGAQQGKSYGVPALIYHGRPLLGFASAKAHLSVFPFSPTVIDQVRTRLDGYSLSKGTIRFSEDRPVPDDVIREVVELRKEEIDAAVRADSRWSRE